ncbi:MAG: hypothetical protein K9K38_23040 [Rhodoferax sp.]|nr:hypothetical protein [Rhodoferax sp.]
MLGLGLAWSGWVGVPRKTSHADVLQDYPGYLVAMGSAAFGGLLAIIGAVLFVFNTVRAVQRAAGPPELRPRRGDVRGRAVALTLARVGVVGMLLAYYGLTDRRFNHMRPSIAPRMRPQSA